MRRLASDPEIDWALQFLAGRIDYERTSGVPYSQRDFSLDRMRQLLALLSNPHESLAIVHVGGTKGKGSTAAMIESILRADGLRTGLYSSPHLDRLEERLRVDARPCSAHELCELVRHVQPAVAEMDAAPPGPGTGRPTYFEIITAMALVHFYRQQVDAVVLEVGLGGRLDSTNVCSPLVSVITSISFDHMQQLGTTLAAIAGEKAGIIKPGVPVVSGVLQNEPREVIAEAVRNHGCELVRLTRDFGFEYRPPQHLENAHQRGQMDFWHRAGQEHRFDGLSLNLTGYHQAANAAVAVAAVIELGRRRRQVSSAAVRQGLSQVEWPARVEVVARHPTVVLDAAHNVASVEALLRALDESFSAARRLLIFATTRDKDVRGMLRVMAGRFDEVIFTRYSNNPRGMPPQELEAIAAEYSPQEVHVCPDPASAWALSSRLAAPQDLVCITGSFFLAAEMRPQFDGCDR
jgi:dihydrofolate synthase / folylpolyglutamate synthase